MLDITELFSLLKQPVSCGPSKYSNVVNDVSWPFLHVWISGRPQLSSCPVGQYGEIFCSTVSARPYCPPSHAIISISLSAKDKSRFRVFLSSQN